MPAVEPPPGAVAPGLFGEGSLAALVQELLVLLVFFASFFLWRWLGQRGGFRPPGSKPKGSPYNDSGIGNASAGDRDHEVRGGRASRGLRQRHGLGAADDPPPAAVRLAEKQMLRHLEQREFTRALNMYRAYERDGRDRHFSEELFSSFVQSAIRVSKVDVVERMLRAMKRNGVMPSLRFWQTTLKMLSSRKHYSTCLAVQTLLGKQIPTDKTVFSCLINAALEVGLPERAAAMLDRYEGADLDAKDHVLLFRTYVALSDVDSAEAVFWKLGSEMTTLMLNLLLLTCVNAKRADRGLSLLREAHAIERGRKEALVDVVSYNTVLKGFSQAGAPRKCLSCLNDMLAHGLQPDDITFGTLLDACIVDNDVGTAHELVRLLLDGDRPMDAVMCSLFIKGLVRANSLPRALELYEEMRRRRGAHIDMITYSVLIKALVDQHDLERALKLVEEMKEGGLCPDDIILTHLLEGCRHASNHALGKRLFESMLASGVKPSEFTLVTMLKLHGRCGAHHEAYNLVAEWEAKHGMKPSVIHYTCVMSGCLRTKSYDQAWAAYELMCASGVEPDSTAIATLLPGMVAAHHWDRALALASEALQPSAASAPVEALHSALAQMQAAGAAGKYAEQLRGLMQGAGIHVAARRQRRPT